jgi:hypothetical protein
MFETDSSLPYIEQEECHRTYWSIYLLDCLVTCGRARPPVFHDHFCKLNLPSTEYAFCEGRSEDSGRVDQFFHDKDVQRKNPAPFARVIVMATVLGRCTRYILQGVDVRSERPPWDTNSDYAAVHSTLLDLEAQFEFRHPIKEALGQDCMVGGQLDQHSAEPVVFAHALFPPMSMFTEPPLLAMPPARALRRESSAHVLLLHTRNLTILLEDARSLDCISHGSFFGYCSLVSGTINSLHQYSENLEIQEESRLGLEMNLAFLTAHSTYWENARPMIGFLILSGAGLIY